MEKISYVNDELLAFLTQHHTRLTPGEVVHFPEGIEREEEGKGGDSQNIEDHPANHVPLASEDENQCLKTVDSCKHDNGKGRNGLSLGGHEVDEVDEL
jgi:hypothetical protein